MHSTSLELCLNSAKIPHMYLQRPPGAHMQKWFKRPICQRLTAYGVEGLEGEVSSL